MKKWIPCGVVRPLAIKAMYTAFDITFDDKFSFAGETHYFYETICVLDGIIGIASDRDVYKIGRENLVIHRPMEFHRIWSEDSTTPRIIIISFDADVLPAVRGTVFGISSDEMMEYEKIYNEIADSCEINSRRINGILPEKQATFQIAINRLENLLLRIITGNHEFQCSEIGRSECASKYADIMNFLGNNIGAQLSIDDVARSCGMSSSGAKQIFHRYTGRGIMQYFRDLKAKEAMKLLNSGLSAKETALKLGFADQNYFSTFFKRATGKSPRAYISGV